MRVVTGAVRILLRAPGRAVAGVLLGLLWVYRTLVSPLLGARCRFYPSCSSYAVEAIHVHGAGKGTALAVARVCRCHPWTAGGVDHVPPRGRWRHDPDPTHHDTGDTAALAVLGTAPEPTP